MYRLPTKKIVWLRIITCVMVFFATIACFGAVLHTLFIRTKVNGLSMYPTLNYHYSQSGEKDIVYINRFAKVKKGDIIVLDLTNHPNFGNYSIKRLVATSGDLVKIILDEQLRFNLFVNDDLVCSKLYNEGFNTYNALNQYIDNHKYDITRIQIDENGDYCVRLKNNEIFALGDNWTVSKDSSLVGPFSDKAIVGKVGIVVKSNQDEIWQIIKSIF